ncbi:hypothetical protein ACQKMN_17080 [Ureibacillus composti]
MNKVIFSRWCPSTWTKVEMYLDNGDAVLIKGKQLKELPSEVISVEGKKYIAILDGQLEVVGFEKAE